MVAWVQTQLQLLLQLLLLRTVHYLPIMHAACAHAGYTHANANVANANANANVNQCQSMYARMSVDLVFSPSMLLASRSGDPPWATRLPYSRQHCLRLTERPAG